MITVTGLGNQALAGLAQAVVDYMIMFRGHKICAGQEGKMRVAERRLEFTVIGLDDQALAGLIEAVVAYVEACGGYVGGGEVPVDAAEEEVLNGEG